jgi:ketopantoate reductase
MLLQLKDRLNDNSTILFLQRGMDVFETVNEKVFPDLRSRPNYLPGIFCHRIRSTSPKERDVPGINPDTLHSLAETVGELKTEAGYFVLNRIADGTLLVDNAGTYPEGQETPKRRKAVEYFLNVLLSAKELGTELIDPKLGQHIRLRDAAVSSVVQLMSVKYECVHGDIIKTKERIEVVRQLLQEAASVVQPFID